MSKSFTSWKLRSFSRINLLVAVPTTLVQFGLRATRPLKDYPCNTYCIMS